jgi:carbon-monoxide dehydrogenase medium subunit
MIPAEFKYAAPSRLSEVFDLLAEHGDDAKILAGGQSLLPLMKLRLAAPAVLVDLGRIECLRYINAGDDGLSIGAMTTYWDLESSAEVAGIAPLLAQSVSLVGDAQIRNRGTLGGALAHADPAGDLPAVMLAVDATVVVSSPRGDRSIAAQEFFVDMFQTALEPDEVLTEIRIPPQPSTQHYEKFRMRRCDWAIVASAVSLRVEAGVIADSRVALANAGSTPVRLHQVESALLGCRADAGTFAEASSLAPVGLTPTPDVNAPLEYKLHLASVLTKRALGAAAHVA